MIENLHSVNVFAPTVAEIIVNLLLSLACSFFITIIYRFSYKGPGFSDSFVNSIMFLSLITTLVIMVIGNNLARAFGLVGAMSIIRFRTAIKDTLDIVYIFFGLAVGMSVGVGYHKLAIIGSLIIGIILFAFNKTNIFTFRNDQYLLQFVGLLDLKSENKLTSLLDKYCNKYSVINIKSIGNTSEAEYSYYVSFKRSTKPNEFISNILQLDNAKNVNLFFDEERV